MPEHEVFVGWLARLYQAVAEREGHQLFLIEPKKKGRFSKES